MADPEHKVASPLLRIITGSYEHHLLCLSLALSSSSSLFTPVFHFAPHAASIRALATSKRYLVSGSNDEHIRLYDLQKRKEIGTLMHHTGSVSCLVFVGPTTGKWLLSAADDGKILIWRTKDWEVLAELTGHKGAINDLAVHFSGKIALSVGTDRTLRLWNLMTGKNASVLKLRAEPLQVAWNARDGSSYAVGFHRKIVLYDTASSVVLAEVELASTLYKLRFHDDHLVVSDAAGAITFRNATDLSVDFSLVEHKTRVKDFTFYVTSDAPFTQATTLLVSASSDGTIVVTDLARRQPVAVYATGERLNCLQVVSEHVEKYETRRPADDSDESADENDDDDDSS
ncbi:WD40-repeat-containing domain protein [Lipomyces japonicus]|uniref:WD40-repeat-containing domain protein n=1 Tax=Lipomyces japonicus TaxID=56871 RepID=UPI0034CF55F2